MAITNKQLKSFARMLSLGGVLVVGLGLIYLFFTPKTYEASVKIRMRNWISTNSFNNPQAAFDIATECQVVRSDAILEQVIKNLGLNELWGKRLNNGVLLKPEQCRILLRAQTTVRPVPKSSLIQIQVTGADRDEIVKIANEIARIYNDKRLAEHKAFNADKLALFQKKWEEENQKVQVAQDAIAKLYADIYQNRATNPATMYNVLQGQRAKLEAQYIEQRDELARLKSIRQEQLGQVLSTLDSNPNSLLTASLIQRSKAKTDLVLVQDTYAANSPELKHATLVVDELDKNIAQIIAGIMTGRENEVASSKAALEDINEKLKRASANLKEITAQDATYARAKENLDALIQARDGMQTKMNEVDAHDALIPASVVAEIIDSADSPQKPVSPDGNLAASTISAGSLAAVAGLFLLLLAPKPKTPPGSGGRPRRP